jgi:hypothetical protein
LRFSLGFSSSIFKKESPGDLHLNNLELRLIAVGQILREEQQFRILLPGRAVKVLIWKCQKRFKYPCKIIIWLEFIYYRTS